MHMHTHGAGAPMAQQHKGPFDSVTLMLVATAPKAAAAAATKTFISPYAAGHQSPSQSAFSVGAPERPSNQLPDPHSLQLSERKLFQRLIPEAKNNQKK